MADNDIYELNVDMTYSGQNLVNVYHFQQDGTDGTGTGRAALAAIWVANFKAPHVALLVSAVNTVQLRIRQLFPFQTQQLIFPIGALGDTIDNGLAPQQCAILNQKGERGGPKGRRGAGHMKISGVPASASAAGRVNDAYAELMNTLGTVFSSKLTDAGSGYTFDSVILSGVDDVPREILSSGSTSRIRTVYSRSIGVGD